jgi:hypothetical protein
MVYMLTFTINIPQMLAIPYIDPMGYLFSGYHEKMGFIGLLIHEPKDGPREWGSSELQGFVHPDLSGL